MPTIRIGCAAVPDFVQRTAEYVALPSTSMMSPGPAADIACPYLRHRSRRPHLIGRRVGGRARKQQGRQQHLSHRRDHNPIEDPVAVGEKVRSVAAVCAGAGQPWPSWPAWFKETVGSACSGRIRGASRRPPARRSARASSRFLHSARRSRRAVANLMSAWPRRGDSTRCTISGSNRPLSLLANHCRWKSTYCALVVYWKPLGRIIRRSLPPVSVGSSASRFRVRTACKCVSTAGRRGGVDAQADGVDCERQPHLGHRGSDPTAAHVATR